MTPYFLLFLQLLDPGLTSQTGLSKMVRFPSLGISFETIEPMHLDNNFENRSLQPWMDCSENGAQWTIEDISTLNNERNIESKQAPPPVDNGTNYLWLKQDFETFGIGILSSPSFLAFPGDEMKFSFWIQSAFQNFNNLEVYWSASNNKIDQKLIELFPISTISDIPEWRVASVQIPINKPAEGKILFHGFCGPKNDQGIIAIDDIYLERKSLSTTISTQDFPITETPIANFSDSTLNSKTMVPAISTIDVTMSTFYLIDTESCPFYPCDCLDVISIAPSAICNSIPSNNLRDDVFQKLNSTFLELGMFTLLPPFNDSIPFDIFTPDITRINWFIINCTNIENYYAIDPFAFNPITFDQLYLFDCNFSNLTFLSQLSIIKDLSFSNSSNFHHIWSTFPADSNIDILRMNQSYLLDLTANDFPIHFRGFTELRIFENEKINDDIIEMFVNWALQFSRDSLIKFYIFNNGLRKIPKGLWRFTRLNSFRIDGNHLDPGIVKEGDLEFSDIALLIRMNNCGIQTIEAGAFQGVYSLTNVYLDNNNLTRFESSVYQPIMEQMMTVDEDVSGFISVAGNPFDCTNDPCHLLWLLRDNRHFLPRVWYASCENGSLFDDILESDPMFNKCQ